VTRQSVRRARAVRQCDLSRRSGGKTSLSGQGGVDGKAEEIPSGCRARYSVQRDVELNNAVLIFEGHGFVDAKIKDFEELDI
jgi:hypothetical protein